MLDATSRHAKLAFVRDQLRMYSGAKKELSDSTFVCCPYHAEKTPSGRIFHGDDTSVPGYFKCYGCGQKAKWDDVAVKLRLKPFKAPKPQVEYAAEIKLDPVLFQDHAEDSSNGELQITGELPKGKVWRGIPTKLLIALGAKRCQVFYEETNYTTEPFIYLPCMVRSKLRGYIRARMKKVKGKPSYLNSKGKWSSTHGLFPLDFSIELMQRTTRNVMVLVEGPRDALRLLKLGIPAVAILGTQSWSDTKTKMLELSGVETVVLMFDGDAPGRKAAKLIKQAVHLMLNVKNFRIPDAPEGEDAWDPGNCPMEVIDLLKRRLKL